MACINCGGSLQKITEKISVCSSCKEHFVDSFKAIEAYAREKIDTISFTIVKQGEIALKCKYNIKKLCENILKAKNITKLQIIFEHLQPDATESLTLLISGLESLQELVFRGYTLGEPCFQRFCEVLKRTNLRIATLSLDAQELKSLECMADALKNLGSLKKLTVAFYGSRDEFSRLIRTVAENRSLTKLRAKAIHLPISDYIDILKKNRSLTKLKANFEPETIDSEVLVEALKVNNTIQSFYLPKIICQPYSTFINSLSTNQSLTQLDLLDHPLTLDDYQLLFTALNHNNRITELRFGNFTVLQQEVFLEFANGIKHNRSLRHVSMYGGAMGINEAKAVCEALKANDTLTQLYHWQQHQMPVIDLTILADVFIENRSLTACRLFKNDFSICDAACARNKEYQSLMISNTIVLIHNIARTSAFEQFPKEIWLEIFRWLRFPGTRSFGDISKKIFHSYQS